MFSSASEEVKRAIHDLHPVIPLIIGDDNENVGGFPSSTPLGGSTRASGREKTH